MIYIKADIGHEKAINAPPEGRCKPLTKSLCLFWHVKVPITLI